MRPLFEALSVRRWGVLGPLPGEDVARRIVGSAAALGVHASFLAGVVADEDHVRVSPPVRGVVELDARAAARGRMSFDGRPAVDELPRLEDAPFAESIAGGI